ncbi:MAG TPA: hypothetical protein VFA15_08470 [Nitrososphaera sp.]|nr:hypothetical protein [Nitrososphaera sp.]
MSELQNERIKLYTALEKSLDSLGGYCKTVTLHQLDINYGISRDSTRAYTLDELENVLRQMFGAGAQIVLRQLRLELAIQQ